MERYLATARLKKRLIALNGTPRGYLHRLRSAMRRHHTEAELPSVNFLWQVVHRHNDKAAPIWQVIEMVRYAERKPDMDELEALDMAEEWFDIEGKEQPSERSSESIQA